MGQQSGGRRRLEVTFFTDRASLLPLLRCATTTLRKMSATSAYDLPAWQEACSLSDAELRE
jgi:hypothetical protein